MLDGKENNALSSPSFQEQKKLQYGKSFWSSFSYYLKS